MIDPRALRDALGAFVTGVTIVTTVDAGGRPLGLTANSFTSVSLDPPLVLFCLAKRSASHDAFRASPSFAIHVLSADQLPLAQTFASRVEDRFAGVDWRPGPTGAPIILESHAWIDCSVEQVVDAGDHVMFLGRVTEFGLEDRRPLGYYRGNYLDFAPDVHGEVRPGSRGVVISWIIADAAGRLGFERVQDGALTLPRSVDSPASFGDAELSSNASALFGSEVTVEFLYSVYDDPASGQLNLAYRGRCDAGSGPSKITWLQPTEIDVQVIASAGDRAIVRRYLVESKSSAFGIYAGTIEDGSVASLGNTQEFEATVSSEEVRL